MGGVRSGWQYYTRNPIHLYGKCGVWGSRAHEQTNQRKTRHAHATKLRPAPQQPKTHVLNGLPAAGGHTRGSTPNSPPAATAGARRPGATRRPGAEAFAHSTSTPLHFNRPGLGPGFLPARPYPATRYKAALGPPAPPHLGPGSAAKIRHPAQIATADSVDLRQTHQAS